MSNGQYRLEAFGFQSEWNLWRIARGGLDEPEIDSTRRERDHLYESDFGSWEDEQLAIRIFPKIVKHIDPFLRERMTPKPPFRMEPR